MTSAMKSKLDLKFKKIPFIGPFFIIANAYASYGKPAHFSETVPLVQWRERLGVGLLSSAALAIVLLMIVAAADIEIGDFKPEDIVLSLYPNLLGFGIGVFALLFALPNEFLTKLIQTSDEKKKEALSPEMLPVDLAYPLAVYCLSIIITVVCNVFPDSWLSTGIVLTILFYGLFVTLGY